MRNIQPGFSIVGKDGREIGKIASCTQQYCEVTTGIFGLGRTLYVPMGAITTSQGSTVYVDASSDQIDQLGWDKPPTGQAASSFFGTMPAGNISEVIEAEEADRASPMLPFVQAGWPVICAQGQEVGRVAAVLPQSLILDEGTLLEKTRKRVPARDVHHVAEGKVWLRIECADLARLETVDA